MVGRYLMPRPHTKADKRRFSLLVTMGCIVCSRFHMKHGVYPEIHHIDGKTKPGSHQKTLPLCSRHHRIHGNGWVSRHGDGKKAFESRYATEEELLDLTNKLIDAGCSTPQSLEAWIDEYFDARPQLTPPQKGVLGYAIPPEWKPVIEKLFSER